MAFFVNVIRRFSRRDINTILHSCTTLLAGEVTMPLSDLLLTRYRHFFGFTRFVSELTMNRQTLKKSLPSQIRGLATLVVLALIGFSRTGDAGIIVLGQDLSTGKGLSNLQTDPQWRVAYTYHNKRDLETKVLSAPYFPFGHHWLLPSKDSNWIAPALPAFTQRNAPAGIHGLYQSYSTKFYLQPWETKTAFIGGGLMQQAFRWSSDNNGLKILLNAHQVWKGNTRANAYKFWHNQKAITTGFQAGWNTLEFLIKNNPVLTRTAVADMKHCGKKSLGTENPTAFRFEGGIYYDPTPPGPTPVPEPSSIVMLMMGATIAMSYRTWRRGTLIRKDLKSILSLLNRPVLITVSESGR